MPGAEPFAADVTDPDALRAATTGATVVYHAAQPAYTRWPQEFPTMTRRVVDAAAAAGATLVMVDNLYLYGPVPGGYGPGTPAGPLTEQTPVTATGRKGAVRAAMAAELAAAHRSGRLPVAVARLADYYGPGGLSSAVGAQLFESALAGKPATWLGSADHPHSLTYLPDAARALATLGTEPAAAGHVFHVPNAAAVTPREFVRLVHAAAGAPHRLRVVPAWLVRAAGVAVPLARELAELGYQVRQPFVADHGAFETAFGPFGATTHDVAVAETLHWFADRRSRTSTGSGPVRS